MSQHRSSHAAHRFAPDATGPTRSATYVDAHRRDPESPEVCELLETLDDAMFAAMTGDAEALQRARELWSQAIAALGPDLIDESREQYLRYAVEVSRRFQASEIRNPAAAIAALEVIELLTSSA